MKVRDFIDSYMEAGYKSVSCTNAKLVKSKFKPVLNEVATELGNDTLLGLEFNTTWQKIHEFIQNQQKRRK